MSLFCTACGCGYASSPYKDGDVCGDLSGWSRIPCAGILREGPYDDSVQKLREAAQARSVEGKVLAFELANKAGLSYKELDALRRHITKQIQTAAKSSGTKPSA